MLRLQIAESRKWLNCFLSLVYPASCINCGTSLYDHEKYLCLKCIHKLPATGYEMYHDNPVARMFWGRVPLRFAVSFFHYRKNESLRQLIRMLKYHNEPQIGIMLGKMSGLKLLKSPYYEKPDLIIPVPLHPERQRKRGYNQCEMIAEGLSAVLQVPIESTLLLRARNNSSQTTHSGYERWENVEDVFATSQGEKYTGKHLLIVDDVVTTGATIEACCQTLLKDIPNIRLSAVSLGYSHQ